MAQISLILLVLHQYIHVFSLTFLSHFKRQLNLCLQARLVWWSKNGKESFVLFWIVLITHASVFECACFFFRENIYVKSFDVRKPSSTNFRKPNLSSAQTEEFQRRFNITHWQEACLTTEHWKIKCSRAFFCAKEAQLTDISLTTKLITSICEEAYKVICLSKDHWVH